MRIGARVAALLLAIFLPWQAAAGPVLLFEAGSGKVLYAENPDDQWHPASLTKIMTAYLVFEALRSGKLKLDGQLMYSENAAKQPPSKIGMKPGQEIGVELAIRALIIKSANDIAVALAEGIGGSEEAFVNRMNATAKRLGMTRTRFANPNGLPAAGQVTTARDLARLSRAVVRDFPRYNAYWSLSDMTIGKVRLKSHNELLDKFEGADGLKTGFICDSGFNIVASSTRNGVQLMAVVLGGSTSGDRNVKAASLLEHGYNVREWKTLFGAQTLDTLARARKPRPAVSVRKQVQAWACGWRPPGYKASKARKVKRVRKGKARPAKAARPANPGQAAKVAKPASK